MEKQMFALDIGTRTVTGIIVQKLDHQTFEIIDYEMKEHEERSMLDGQIHNVLEVAQVIQEVKARLEAKHGPLSQVSVAAAGRSLLTERATATIELNNRPLTEEATIHHLELSAVQQAQFHLAQQQEESSYENYYCVGYSVLYYKLDDEVIGSLIDQRGLKASVEVIATFLPRVVVESLLATLKRAELSMQALTLEPIAAIHALVPESMRRLNVAIVDIGAGTSDIAITKESTISSYGMVPLAGDLITEKISDQYLLDFKAAEQFKREVVNQKEAKVEDVLGFEQTVTEEQLLEVIKETVDDLAEKLAEKILLMNDRPPQAIMLIGGGSQTPALAESLAAKLKLPNNRVAVRDIRAIQNVKTGNLPLSPEFVTPIGIALTAAKNPVNYLTVMVNEEPVRMFEMKELTLGDCLIQAGHDIKSYYGKPGLGMVVTVNGEEVTIPGSLGQPPTLFLNGRESDIHAAIEDGDVISLQPGQDGEEAQVSLEELLGESSRLKVQVNGRSYSLETAYHVNGELKDAHYLLQDGDKVKFQQTFTLRDLFTSYDLQLKDSLMPFYVYVNEERLQLEQGEQRILMNGLPVAMTALLRDGAKIELLDPEPVTLANLLERLDQVLWEEIPISFNGEELLLRRQLIEIIRGETALQEADPIYPGDRLSLKEKQRQVFIFQDVFRLVDIQRPEGKANYALFKNDQPANFHEPIMAGDRLSLKWLD